MGFKYKIQQYQTDAVNALVNVFEGQPYFEPSLYKRDLGERVIDPQNLFAAQDALNDELEANSYKNHELSSGMNDQVILENLRKIQGDQNMPLSEALSKLHGRYAFDVEMETGTGKTYVYVKTIFELNKRYGWSKFIIIVPSVAIREGVQKSFEDFESHFMEYYGKKARHFIYDSDNLTQIDDFAKDGGIHVMIINTQAFAKSFDEAKAKKEAEKELKDGKKSKDKSLRIYTKRDDFNSRRPIDVIAANNPIIILDEPQKMGGVATQNALKNFNPLFFINYSATHKVQHNLVYALDAVDAYRQKLVKKIQVKGFQISGLHGTEGYVFAEKIELSTNKPPQVRIELEVAHKSGIKRESHLMKVGDDLYATSNGMEQYKNYKILSIDPIANCIEISTTKDLRRELAIGTATKDLLEEDIRRIQIRETLLSHFEKEAVLFEKGIKTLSLFFIDKVENYRKYDEEGNAVLGRYGEIFEEEYRAIYNEYRTLFTPEYNKYLSKIDVHETHNGYFSIDKGRMVDSKSGQGADKGLATDISAYELILKNKQRLLSFNEPTRFIFSHSALREGWDNPNIFQICTLKNSDNDVSRRQEVGRGMRLCVNTNLERMDLDELGTSIHEINQLTVVASESYKEFVKNLQKEMSNDGLRKRNVVIEEKIFVDKKVRANNDNLVKLDEKQAKAIYKYLVKNDYIDDDNHISQAYKDDRENGALAPMPEALASIEHGIHTLIQSLYEETSRDEMFEDGMQAKFTENKPNERFYKKEFQTLWQTINHKYAYTVQFDSDELIRNAVNSINAELSVTPLRYTLEYSTQKEEMDADDVRNNGMFEDTKTKSKELKYAEVTHVRYDLIGKIAEQTILTRKSVSAILQRISNEKYAMFAQNPESFIKKVSDIIVEQKASMFVEHLSKPSESFKLSYHEVENAKPENENDPLQANIFAMEHLNLPISKAYKAQKAIQDYIFTDGNAGENSVEAKFAKELDGAEEVNIYAKLPKGFYIPTPVGRYSPDWAIVFHEGKVKHIYFVAETKGTLSSLELRPVEKAKIDSAKLLFAKLSNGTIKYDHVTNYKELLNLVQ